MTITTNSNEKLFFKYFLKNRYFEHTHRIFENGDIKSLYEYVQTYYNEFSDIPKIATIAEKSNVSRNIINILFDLSELDNINNDWLESILSEYVMKRKADLMIMDLMDQQRNGNYETVANKLNISREINNSEDVNDEIEFPKITDEIYKKLPDTLFQLTKDFEGRKKDVLLTSILSCISIFFSDIKSHYFEGAEVYNNIYTFVIAKSGLGKSIMKKAELLTRELTIDAIETYNKEKLLFDENDDKKNTQQPKEHIYVAGADTTQQGLLKYMQNNDGKFLIFATEAEALTSKSKDVNGDYTLIIRESIQNDKLTKLLKTESALYIEKPKLNICVSGTFDQIDKIIGKNGNDNGTFNRFIYYYWDEESTIENPFKNRDSNDLFKDYGKRLLSFYNNYLKTNKLELNFNLTEKQQLHFYNRLNDAFINNKTFNDDSADAIIKRHFLFAYKLLITFSALRKFDEFLKYSDDDISDSNDLFSGINNMIIDDNFSINDGDLDNVIDLIEVYLQHSLNLLNSFTPKFEINIQKSWKKIIWDNLPTEFNRAKIITEGALLKKGDKTIDKLIKEWKNTNKIEKNGYTFKKIN